MCDFDKAISEQNKAQVTALNNLLTLIEEHKLETVSQVTGMIHTYIESIEQPVFKEENMS